jgi:hypothetical protein
MEIALDSLRLYFDYSIKSNEMYLSTNSVPIQYTALNIAALYISLNRRTQALAVYNN